MEIEPGRCPIGTPKITQYTDGALFLHGRAPASHVDTTAGHRLRRHTLGQPLDIIKRTAGIGKLLHHQRVSSRTDPGSGRQHPGDAQQR